MRDDNDVKWLPAARLIELLAKLPADCRVMPNAVGNLLVQSPDGEQDIGHIDLGYDGSVEYWEDALISAALGPWKGETNGRTR